MKANEMANIRQSPKPAAIEQSLDNRSNSTSATNNRRINQVNIFSISALPRKISVTGALFVCAVLLMKDAIAAGPPNLPRPFIVAPILNTFQAIATQRHQSRTQLYREALEELRKNPQAADVPECPPIQTATRNLCIRRPYTSPTAGTAATASGADASAATPPAQDAKPELVELSPTLVEGLPSGMGMSAARRRIAVLVGNNSYKEPIPVLGTPIADVEEIARVLHNRFGYETKVLRDASKTQIIETLNKIAEEAKPEDSVLLFYAGHGYLMDDTKMGFWIPVDGSVNTAANWISNTDISKLLHAIPSRQIILISDSCFSGSLTREQKLTSSLTPKVAEILQRRAVLALSSGDEEPVSDEGKGGHSIFAWYFIKALESVKVATVGFEIYRTVRDNVVKDYPQAPQYGAVFSAGHTSGGEYLLDIKQ